ncbi:MAG: HYR domain-containing protein [Synergistaceae bacterium]|nr:HYR domain-containing protein [Synergistaceae bacterium]
MSKKFFVLFLALCMTLLAVSGAMAASGYALVVSDDNEDPEAYDSNLDDLYIGYNYKAKYTRPTLSLRWYQDLDDEDEYTVVEGFTVDWKLSPDISGITITAATDSVSGDNFILSGVVPSTSVDRFDILATVKTVTSSQANGAIGQTYLFENVDSLSVSSESTHILVTPTSGEAQFNGHVVVGTGVELTKASQNYSVVVNASQDSSGYVPFYVDFIQSSDEAAEYMIDLPDWLTVSSVTYATSSDFNVTDADWTDFGDGGLPIKSITISTKSGVTVSSDAKGAVHIPFYAIDGSDVEDGIVLGWEIEGGEPDSRPFGISGDKEVNLKLTAANQSKSQDLTYTGTSSVVKFEVSGDLASRTELFNITSTDLSADTHTGTITVTFTTPSVVNPPHIEYKGSLIFFDALNASVDVSYNIVIDTTGQPGTFSLTLSKAELPLAPGSSDVVTVTANDGKAVSWDVSAPTSSGISATVTASSDYSASITVSAASTAASGDYTVTVSALDENNVTASKDITVKVLSSAFAITLDINSFSVAPGVPQVVKATAVNGEVVSWDISADKFTYSIVSTDASADITLTASSDASGDYTVKVLAKDSNGTIASRDVVVTVSTTAYSVVISPDAKTITLARGGSDTVTLTNVGNPSGNVTWTATTTATDISADVASSSNSSATIRISADSSAATGDKTVTVTATDAAGNSGTATITVTVSSSGTSYDVELSPKTSTITITRGRASTVTLTNTATPSGDVTWTAATADSADISVDVSGTNASATVHIGVYTTAAIGDKTITVTATDAAGNSDTATITVTVTSVTYGVALSPKTPSISIVRGGSGTVTLSNTSTSSGDVTWRHSAATTDISVDIASSSNYSATVRIGVYSTATLGSKTVTITATDAGGNSDTATITVTVTGGSDPTDPTRRRATGHQISSEILNKAAVLSTLRGRLGNYEPRAYSNFVTNSRYLSEFTSGDVLTLPMPPSSDIPAAGIYVCSLSYSDFSSLFTSGDRLYLYLIRVVVNADGSEAVEVTSNVDTSDTTYTPSQTLMLFDDEGNEITVMPASETAINFAAYLTASSDNEAYATDTQTNTSTLGPSGAGCNAGFGSLFGMLGMAFTASALYLRKRS